MRKRLVILFTCLWAFFALTRMDGQTVYVSTDWIQSIQPTKDLSGGYCSKDARSVLFMSDAMLCVMEPPDEVVKRMVDAGK